MAATPRPTAVLCGNDVLAFGALLEAQRMGIVVPGELSIVGFDDLEMARHMQPALTTVHVPTQTLWQAVADRLIAMLAQLPVPASTEGLSSRLGRLHPGPSGDQRSRMQRNPMWTAARSPPGQAGRLAQAAARTPPVRHCAISRSHLGRTAARWRSLTWP